MVVDFGSGQIFKVNFSVRLWLILIDKELCDQQAQKGYDDAEKGV